MKTVSSRRRTLGILFIGIAGLWGCATPAVVFVSPDYHAQNIKRVTVQGFSDAPGQPGSGGTLADVFEKYLFSLNYQIIDPGQGSADATITGSISELTNTSEQTVMVDMPQEVTEPIYQDVVVQRRHGLRTVTQQTGTQTVVTDQSIPETETLPARVGLSVRMVSSKNGELLWSGSGSADGLDIPSAADACASKVVNALQKALAKPAPSSSN